MNEFRLFPPATCRHFSGHRPHFLGTAGYMLLEHLGHARRFRLTVITLSTVGYGEVCPHPACEVFTMLLIRRAWAGWSLFSTVTDYIGYQGCACAGAAPQRWQECKDRLTLFCGFGCAGRQVARNCMPTTSGSS